MLPGSDRSHAGPQKSTSLTPKGTVPARRIDPCNLLFDFYCIAADPALWPNEKFDPTARSGPAGMRLVTLKAVSGPGDDGEPVMTFMLPEED